MADKIELDELLSVKIPAFLTPAKTKKMLAITTVVYPTNRYQTSIAGFGNTFLSKQNIRHLTKVYYISDLLDKYSQTTTDKDFLEVAGKYFSQIDLREIAPSEYIKLKNSLESIERQIEQKEKTLDRYNSREINNFNKLIDRQNELVNELNSLSLETRCITSIGGGINLRPGEFKKISRNRNSPKLREIAKIKSTIKTVGKIAKSGNWVRSNSGIDKARINTISANQWSSSKMSNGQIKYTHQSTSGNNASVIKQNSGSWTSKTIIGDSKDVIKYFKDSNQLFVSHPIFPNEYRGTISQGGNMIKFYP